MPFRIGPSYGYVDLFINPVFKKPIEDLDRQQIINNDHMFFQMCRLIMMPEFRGMKQVHQILKTRMVKDQESFYKIYKVIERDEPWHCYPYQYRLKKIGHLLPHFQEKATDLWIYYSLIFLKYPGYSSTSVLKE